MINRQFLFLCIVMSLLLPVSLKAMPQLEPGKYIMIAPALLFTPSDQPPAKILVDVESGEDGHYQLQILLNDLGVLNLQIHPDQTVKINGTVWFGSIGASVNGVGNLVENNIIKGTLQEEDYVGGDIASRIQKSAWGLRPATQSEIFTEFENENGKFRVHRSMSVSTVKSDLLNISNDIETYRVPVDGVSVEQCMKYQKAEGICISREEAASIRPQ